MHFGSQHFGGRGRARALGWDYEEWQALNHSHEPAQNQTTSWLVHSWNIFGARTSHGQTWIHKTHQGLDLGEATTFLLIVYFVPLHEAHIQMAVLSRDSQMRVRKFPKLRLSWIWGHITLCADLRLRWGLDQSCSPHQELSNGMSHATCTEGNRVDSWFLVVGSQIANLTPDLSFAHNLCFKCPNESCKPISYIYVSIAL